MKPDQRAPHDAFEGPAQVHRRAPGYHLALLAACVSLWFLPTAYAALVSVIGWALALHTIYGAWLLGQGAFGVLSYAIPFPLTLILCFGLLRQLFQPKGTPDTGVELDRKKQHRLFEFVGQIAESIGAAPPTVIEVDTNVNATVAFDARRDGALVLTLGLPLVAVMDTRQLAAVIAHEMGHVRQAHSMRLSFWLRAINRGLKRISHGAGRWETHLVAASKAEIPGLMVPAGLALFSLRGARAVLKGPLGLGQTASRFLIRQMELDADRYSIAVAGSDVFESTHRLVAVATRAQSNAHHDNRLALERYMVTDDFPALVQAHLRDIPRSARDHINQQIDAGKTQHTNTHPCARQRIERARRNPATGIFHASQPARTVFADFEALCRRATQVLYCPDHQAIDPLIRLVPPAHVIGHRHDVGRDLSAYEAHFSDAETRPSANDRRRNATRLAAPATTHREYRNWTRFQQARRALDAVRQDQKRVFDLADAVCALPGHDENDGPRSSDVDVLLLKSTHVLQRLRQRLGKIADPFEPESGRTLDAGFTPVQRGRALQEPGVQIRRLKADTEYLKRLRKRILGRLIRISSTTST